MKSGDVVVLQRALLVATDKVRKAEASNKPKAVKVARAEQEALARRLAEVSTKSGGAR